MLHPKGGAVAADVGVGRSDGTGRYVSAMSHVVRLDFILYYRQEWCT